MASKQRSKWDDARFDSEMRRVIEAVNHFPTNSELRAMGRLDLANQIARRGGFVSCARAFGSERPKSDSDTGWIGEEEASARLSDLGFVVEHRDGVKCPFDLLVDAVLRVDVKAARLSRYHHSCGWFYRIGKHPQSDVILLWQLDTGEFYAIPWFVCPRTNMTISRDGGKYAAFRNSVELLRDMVATRKQELERLGANLLRAA